MKAGLTLPALPGMLLAFFAPDTVAEEPVLSLRNCGPVGAAVILHCGMEVVSLEWPQLNDGVVFTDHLKSRSAPGCTVLQYYSTRHSQAGSVADWRHKIEQGQVKLNGYVFRDPQACIPPNALLEYHRAPWGEPPAPCSIGILHRDRHLLVAHKPAGLQVLPGGPFHQRCVLSLLRAYHQQHADQLVGQPAPVHRLGRGTSGVLVCACSEAARRELSRRLAEHGSCKEEHRSSAAEGAGIRKIYLALVQGLVQEVEGEILVPIGRIEYPGVMGGLFAASPGTGKPARSRFRVLRKELEVGRTVVEVEIFTGRPHQIRIHMAAIGHPLVGDPLYGPGGVPQPDSCSSKPQASMGTSSTPEHCDGKGSGGAGPASGLLQQDSFGAKVLPGDCGYLLHCWVMEFDHPVTRERLHIVSPPPPELS